MKKIHQLYFKEFLYTFKMTPFKKILIFFILLQEIQANEMQSYGYDIPNTPITVGGYLDAVYDDKATEKFIFDDISLLVSARHNRFDFLSEIEISYLSLNGTSNSSSDIEIHVEHFQFMYALSDTENLTLGHFNSDIGYWNQTPVNILQATTTKPHIFESIFPAHTTGLMYQNHLNDEDSFSMTFQHNKDIGQQDDNFIVDRHIAMAYQKTYDELSLRLALGYYRENTSKKRAYYLGLGSEYESDDFTFQGELYTQQYEDEHQSYNAYVQSVWHFLPKHDAVVRLEHYDDQGLHESISLLGYVYRPTANMAWKGEYVHHSNLPLNRFVYSFSVLF